jgi:hypothetical protein
VDGNIDIGNREIMAEIPAVGRSRDTTNVSGFFAIPISSSAQNYEVKLGWQAWDEFMRQNLEQKNPHPVMAAPGDTVKLEFGPKTIHQIMVRGKVTNQNGGPLPFPVDVSAKQFQSFNQKHLQTDQNGHFLFNFQEHETGDWEFAVSSSQWSQQYMVPQSRHMNIFQFGDTLQLDILVFATNDTIWGIMEGLEDSTLFNNQEIFAENDSTGFTNGHVDSNGLVVLPISSVGDFYKISFKDSSYQKIVQNGYFLQNSQPIFAAPGDTVYLQFSNAVISLGNLMVNGVKGGAKIQQGDIGQWNYQISVGGTANLELWVDVNNDSMLQENQDLHMFDFKQIDGGFSEDAPPDKDGIANGIVFTEMPMGLAPARYFLRVFNLTDTDTAEFEILPIPQPTTTFFGQVFDQNGIGAPWVMVQAEPERSEGMPDFRYVFTDSTGNYVLAMDGIRSAPEQNWQLKLHEKTLNQQIPIESHYSVQVSGNAGPYDFHLVLPTIFMQGIIVDENHNPVFDQVISYAWSESKQVGKQSTMVDSSGKFILSFSDQDTGNWEIGISSRSPNNNFMEPVRQTFLLDHSQDTVKVEFTLYHTNAFIRGRIVADGDPMVANRRIVAYSDTTGSSEIFSNHDGSFSIPVSDQANNYFVRMEWDDFDQFMNAGFEYQSLDLSDVSPGDSVVLQFSRFPSAVVGENNLPLSFALEQNYPNPLSLRLQVGTTVLFSIPQKSQIQIDVYNILGQKVAELLNSELGSGKHTVQWSGMDLTGHRVGAGVYFIRMITPGFVQNRKLLIIR